MKEPAGNLKEPFVASGADDRSPLDILNEKLLRLGALSQEGDAAMPVVPKPAENSLGRVESRFTALLETLVARSAQAEERSADMFEAVSRATEATDQKVTEALRSISACMEAVERAPRVSLHLIRTVSTRLDQIEERLPHVNEAVLNPIRVAIESLESRLEALRLSPEAANDAGMASLAGVEARLESILAQVSKLEPNAKRQERQTEVVGELTRKLDALETANREFRTSLDERFADLGAKVPPNAIPAIRDQIDVLTREIGGWRAGPSDAVIADLRRDIADVAKAVASSAPGPVLSGLEDKIAALGEKIDATREAGVSDIALAPLKKMLADVARRIQAIKPVTLDGVEAELRTLSRRLERPATPPVDPTMIEALAARLEAVHGLMLSQGHQVETIRRFVDAGGPPQPDLGAITSGLAALTLQVETLAKTMEAGRSKPLDKSFSALGSQLGEARQEIADLRRIIDAQAQLIADLSGKLGDVHRATVPIAPEVDALAAPDETAPESPTDPAAGDDAPMPESETLLQDAPSATEARPPSSGPKLRLRVSQAAA